MTLKIIDGHCDVLWKMDEDKRIDFNNQHKLHVTYDRIKQFSCYVQNFAIFVEPLKNIKRNKTHVHTIIDIFQKQIIEQFNVTHITNRLTLQSVDNSSGVGAILSLEGCDCLENPLQDVFELYTSGVRILSLTWNHSNWAADGTYGDTHDGLSTKGKQFVKTCEDLNIIIDVSHLSDKSFSQLNEMATKPLIATHSNCRAICHHPRNLSDEQIRLLINNNGIIGLNLVPMFVSSSDANVFDFIKHFEHICSLGGHLNVSLGSDYDGIEQTVNGLEHCAKWYHLTNEMHKIYDSKTIEDFMFNNWFQFLSNNLP